MSRCLLLLTCAVFQGQISSPRLRTADAIAFDALGNLVIADASGNQVLEATLGGGLLVVAGTGVQGFAGDGAGASSAELNDPQGVAFGSDGTLFIADTGNQRVRAVSTSGAISTVAGTGVSGFSGDGGSALMAQFRKPTALAVDGTGALLICDEGNRRVRRVLAGIVSTFAGTGVQGFGGDGGQAKAAELDTPDGLAVAADGRVFVSDGHSHRVRVVGEDGVVHTFVGTGVPGFAGDGGPAVSAQIFAPHGLAWTGSGNLLLADAGNQRVRQVNGAGVITTVAGSGTEGMGADDATGLLAPMRSPRAVAVSFFGLPVTADTLNGAVRELAGAGVLLQPAALVAGRSSAVSASGANSQTYGKATLLVSVLGSAGLAQGAIQLSDGGTPLSGGVLSNGNLQVDLSSVNAGQHSLSATYLGDGLNPRAVSAPVNVAILPLNVSATAASTSIVYGLPLPLLSGVLSGVLPQDAGGVSATFQANTGAMPSVGAYPITASLQGPKAANYSVTTTSSSGSLTVLRAGTGVKLGGTGQAYIGLPLTLTASVASVTSGQPTGTAEFLDGSNVVATAPVIGGVATATYDAASEGARNLSVLYLGDANFLPSTSSSASISVLPLPDFTVATSGASSATASAGGNATYNLVIHGSQGAFTGAVSFAAAGLPPGTNLTFSPPQVVPGAGSANVTVAVQTSATVSRVGDTPQGGWNMRMVESACAVLLIFCKRKGRRRQGLWMLGVTMVLLTGCGARTVGEGSGGVLAQTYTLQITGTGTNLAGTIVTHSTALTLTVQQ